MPTLYPQKRATPPLPPPWGDGSDGARLKKPYASTVDANRSLKAKRKLVSLS